MPGIISKWFARSGFLALVLVGVGGCRNIEVASSNLDALHGENARHRYQARIQKWYQYYLSQIFDPRWFSKDAALFTPRMRDVEDPSDSCLEYLIDLGDDAPPDAGAEATQVRQFAYLGVECPWALSRERALVHLGEAATRLQLIEPVPEPELAANAPQLSEALAGLVEAVQPLLTGRAAETERENFAAACELLESMPFDIEGGRRLLRAVASLYGSSGGKPELREPLTRLSRSVQRQLVGLALARALEDEVARVRAAAFEANWCAFGGDFLGDALLALDGAPASNLELETRHFELREEWPGEPDVFVRVFQIIEEHGLPRPAGISAQQAERLRLAYLRTLCQIAVDYTVYRDRTRTAAMRALSAVSGSGFESLRLEDWQRWWEDYTAEIMRASEGRPRATGEPLP